MKRVLITGGCGFIGSNLTNYFLKKRVKVIVLDKYNFHNNYGWLEDIKNNKNLEVELGDIRDYDIVNNTIKKVDSVIHLANIANDPGVELNPNLSWEVNVLATKKLADLAAESGKSGEVYQKLLGQRMAKYFEDLNKKFGTLPSGKELPTVVRPAVTVPITEQITDN